ncbi:MAG: rod shape-determining protein MreC [Actinomycetes bacterium]
MAGRDRRRARLLLTLLLLTAFTLITLDYRSGGSPFGFLRSAASSVFGPLERAATAIAKPVGNAVSDLGHLGRDRSHIKQLEDENAQLNEQLRLGQLDKTRLDEFNRMYGLTQRGRMRTVAAHVIGLGGGLGFERTAAVDAGSRDGIRKNMTVINGDGLVGRVERVGPTTSTVLLAIDANFRVFTRLAPGLETGYLRGVGPAEMTLSLLSQTATVHTGQTLVTAGPSVGSFFPPEIPVGVVTHVEQTPGALIRSAQVRPFVNFTGLDIVGIIVSAPKELPRGALLPPSPTPSPKPRPSTPSPGTSVSPSPGRRTTVSPTPTHSPSPTARPTRSP